MFFLKLASEIELAINKLASYPILWVDTEVADWQTPNPRLSLIQVLANTTDLTGESTYILDVLDRPDLVRKFIDTIIINSNIEKVFHNAAFDLRYLGGKESTRKMGRHFN
jgi:ribonuclease D